MLSPLNVLNAHYCNTHYITRIFCSIRSLLSILHVIQWSQQVFGWQSKILRPGLDNVTDQPWCDATCPRNTSDSDYFRFVTFFLSKQTRQITKSGGTGPSCISPWTIYGLDWVVPEGMSQVSRRLDVGSYKQRALNNRLSSSTPAHTSSRSLSIFLSSSITTRKLYDAPGRLNFFAFFLMLSDLFGYRNKL